MADEEHGGGKGQQLVVHNGVGALVDGRCGFVAHVHSANVRPRNREKGTLKAGHAQRIWGEMPNQGALLTLPFSWFSQSQSLS